MRRIAGALLLSVAVIAQPQPVKVSMSAVAAVPLHKGAPLEAKIVAKIDEGWHLYALDQAPGGPLPSSIVVPAGQPFALAAAPRQSDPLGGFDNTFEMDTRYFLEEASFTVPLTAQADIPAGAKLRVNFTYQTCNESECLPPTTVKLETAIVQK